MQQTPLERSPAPLHTDKSFKFVIVSKIKKKNFKLCYINEPDKTSIMEHLKINAKIQTKWIKNSKIRLYLTKLQKVAIHLTKSGILAL